MPVYDCFAAIFSETEEAREIVREKEGQTLDVRQSKNQMVPQLSIVRFITMKTLYLLPGITGIEQIGKHRSLQTFERSSKVAHREVTGILRKYLHFWRTTTCLQQQLQLHGPRRGRLAQLSNWWRISRPDWQLPNNLCSSCARGYIKYIMTMRLRVGWMSRKMRLGRHIESILGCEPGGNYF